MSDRHNQRAAEIIKKILYITIASVSAEGEPWNSPVYSAFDEELNFYWFSDKNSQHSQNIQKNKNVFLVIYDSTVPEGTGEGVYIKAEAQELTVKDEVLAALRAMDDRVGKTKESDFTNYTGEAVLRGYRAKPLGIWMNDDELDKDDKYVRDIRIEVPLKHIIENIEDETLQHTDT